MAMFSKRDSSDSEYHTPISSPTQSETVIGPTVRVEGTFTSDDNMRVEGQISGNITTTKNVLVGKEAKIEADIVAANMEIHGEIRGNLTANDTVRLGATAKVYGNITTQVVSIETGAVIQGQCMTRQSEAPKSNANTAESKETDKEKTKK
jgi:cytoskeletal protein CcmA (bactofilin family)